MDMCQGAAFGHRRRLPMRTAHFTDARSNLKNVIDRVVEDADMTLITRR